MRVGFGFLTGVLLAASAVAAPLEISVFATAPDVRRYLATPAARDKTAARLKEFRVSRIFLQGRLQDDYVPRGQMQAIRDDLIARGFRVAGGVDFLPGKQWGVRHNGELSWMNYEARKTQEDLATFFRENAPLFKEIILDDAFCTEDTGPESVKARGGRTWAAYRQDLLVHVLRTAMLEPARAARPDVGLIVKFPQWYDRFHLYGYDPVRMSALAGRVWVGTEVRNPKTRRMGYVQPTEGYMVFRWLTSIAGEKVQGAWFDHIDCTAQNFVDQAWQSVLAGARELTFWHLEPVMEGHPGHALFIQALPQMTALAAKVHGRAPRGVAFYKPPGSAGDGNIYLADYLGMIGLPMVPVARYPEDAKVAFLPVQAAADPRLIAKMRKHLAGGATLILTPALVRKLGPAGAELAATRAVGKGRVTVWNLSTFSEQDFRDAGELLLAPKPLSLSEMPQEMADKLRREALAPLGVRLEAPAGVAYYMLGEAHCFYNFLDREVEIRLNGEKLKLAANGLWWR